MGKNCYLYNYKQYYHIIEFLRQTLMIDLWVCEVLAKLTQYIGDRQRVLKMLFTWQILLTCNCNCLFFLDEIYFII